MNTFIPKVYARVHVVDQTLLRLQLEMSVRSIRFNLELFPFHSPLLRESLLVSFPPLINMLKFSGSSHLIRVKEPLKDFNMLICPPSLEYFLF